MLVTQPVWLACSYDGREFDRGQPSQSGLSAAAVVGPLDPGHDRDAQLLAGGPGAAVQDVLLEQREEALHRGVVAAGGDSAHRSDHTMAGEHTTELPASKLGSSIAVKPNSA